MNCKPGELAVIVKSSAGNEGLIVRCIRVVGSHYWLAKDGTANKDFTWLVDRKVRSWTGEIDNEIEDGLLRPIRPGDIPEEEVRDLYSPVPTKEHA